MERQISLYSLIKPFIDAVDGEFTDIHLQYRVTDAKRLMQVLADNPELQKLLESQTVIVEVDTANHDPMII